MTANSASPTPGATIAVRTSSASGQRQSAPAGTKIDLREFVIEEPKQTSITKDNALVDVDFVVFLQVNDPDAAVLNIRNFIIAVRNLVGTYGTRAIWGGRLFVPQRRQD